MKVILNKTRDKIKRIEGIQDAQDQLLINIVTSEANRKKNDNPNFTDKEYVQFIKKRLEL